MSGIDYVDRWYAPTDDVWPLFRAENQNLPVQPNEEFIGRRMEAQYTLICFFQDLLSASMSIDELKKDQTWPSLWSGPYDYKTRNLRLIVKGFKAFYTQPGNWSRVDTSAGATDKDLMLRKTFVQNRFGDKVQWIAMVATLNLFDAEINDANWPYTDPSPIHGRNPPWDWDVLLARPKKQVEILVSKTETS